jgi:hypothetical protein
MNPLPAIEKNSLVAARACRLFECPVNDGCDRGDWTAFCNQNPCEFSKLVRCEAMGIEAEEVLPAFPEKGSS